MNNNQDWKPGHKRDPNFVPMPGEWAYSRELAGESIDAGMDEKYDEELRTFHHVTFHDLERFARRVAYKVATNLYLGRKMDPKNDPLKYVDCDDYPPLIP